MISVIAVLVLVLVVSRALGLLANRNIAQCLPVVLTGTVVWLYCFYCLNILLIGRAFLYLFYACILVFSFSKIAKEKKQILEILQDFVSPPVIFLLVFAAVFLIYSAQVRPAVWDELRLWAAMPKAIHATQALQVGEGSLLYTTMQSYPPGMALLIYFFTAFSGTYSYGCAYAVSWIFAVSLFLPAIGTLSWRNWKFLVPAFLLILLFPMLLTINAWEASGDYSYYYSSMYIEPLLGCVLGAAFFQAVQGPFRCAFDLTRFSFLLFLLPAMKNIGALYAAVVFVCALVLYFLQKQDRISHKWCFIIPVLAIALSYFSWQWLIRTKGTGEFIDLNIAGLTGEKVVTVLKGITAWGIIPFLYFAIFFLLADIILTWRLKDLAKKQMLCIIAGFLVICIVFFYGYTSHYGLMLSSIHRYTQVFTFAMCWYLLSRFFSAVCQKAVVPTVQEPSAAAPKHKLRSGFLLVSEVLLFAAGILLLFGLRRLAYPNPYYPDAEFMTAYAQSVVQQDTDANPNAPAKCYLALGGDIRKVSQQHETFALSAIGSAVNIQNIWCDKLFNEAEDGVVTNPEEKAVIWARNLQQYEYAYVLLANPDAEILDAVQRIAPELNPETFSEQDVLRIEKSDNQYGITFQNASADAFP